MSTKPGCQFFFRSSVHADRATDLGAASALMNTAREPRHSWAGQTSARNSALRDE